MGDRERVLLGGMTSVFGIRDVNNCISFQRPIRYRVSGCVDNASEAGGLCDSWLVRHIVRRRNSKILTAKIFTRQRTYRNI